jgi:hypothetical protein
MVRRHVPTSRTALRPGQAWGQVWPILSWGLNPGCQLTALAALLPNHVTDQGNSWLRYPMARRHLSNSRRLLSSGQEQEFARPIASWGVRLVDAEPTVLTVAL